MERASANALWGWIQMIMLHEALRLEVIRLRSQLRCCW